MPNPGVAVGVGGSVLGGILGSNATEDAADTAAAASRAGVAENRRQFDTVLNLQAPAINTGNAARSLLASIMGLDVAGSTYSPGGTTAGTTGTTPTSSGNRPPPGFSSWSIQDQARWARENERKNTQPVNPTAPGNTPLTFTNPASKAMTGDEIQQRLEAFPGYKFAVEQAQKSAQALGSASGSLGGNVISALGERVGGQIAPSVFNDYLNRLSGLSGGAQTASSAASNAAIQTGGMVAQGLQNAGDARASGILGQANTQIGTIGGILGGIGQYMGNQSSVPYTNGSVGGGGYRYGP